MYRVLLVDDNLINLDVTSRMLQKGGYSVATAATGEEGVRMAALWRYDLIVMDMAMPGISGGEATKRLRLAEQAAGTRRVPVIAFTAHSMSDFRQQAMRSDMDDFITKPIEFRQLLWAVERSLDSRTVILVAEDSPTDRDRTLRYLRTRERTCLVPVTSGAEAVAACARQRITFALISSKLPDISGIETARQIREAKTGEGVRIISVSDKVDPEAREQSLAAGDAGYLEKPFSQADILNLLESPAPNLQTAAR